MHKILDQKYYTKFDPKISDDFYKTLPIAILMKDRKNFTYISKGNDDRRTLYGAYTIINNFEIGKPYRYASIKMILPKASEIIRNDTVIFITKESAITIVYEEFKRNFRKFI